MAIKKVDLREARTHLTELLERAHRGEEIVITKTGRPYARLVPVTVGRDRKPGEFRGQITGDIPGGVEPDDKGWG